MKRVLALTIRPVEAPDTRYRFFQYIEPLRSAGIEVTHRSFLSYDFWRRQQAKQGLARQSLAYLWSTAARLDDIVRLAPQFDAVWIGRELSPIGPPWLERLLFSLNPHAVLDIDDALFLRDDSCTGFIHHRLRDFGKFADIAGRFRAVVCGNRFLADYFRKYSAKVHVIPTVVPMRRYEAVIHRASPRVRIGWIGTPFSAPHLDVARGPLERLAQRHDFEFRVVGAGALPAWDLPLMTQVDWGLDLEMDYFADFDIGIMPLRDFPFAHGKCAFKLIQYMAAGIPVVASPVGANLEVVQDGVNGFLAATDSEWIERLERLLVDPSLRRTLGEHGRQTVRDRFSLESRWRPYAGILKDCMS